MKAYFERAQKLIDKKKAEKEKLKELLLQFKAAKEASDNRLANLLKRQIENLAMGNLKPELQYKQYSKKEIEKLQLIRNKEI